MREKAKKTWYLYQRAMWYLSIAKTELDKPLAMWERLGFAILFLSSVIGIKFETWVIVTVCTIGLLLGIIVGKILTVAGVVSFNQKLANSQNPELLEIKKMLEDMKNK